MMKNNPQCREEEFPPLKVNMARFHAAGAFQQPYLRHANVHDELSRELSPGWCQSPTRAPYVNGIMGPMYGRNTLPSTTWSQRTSNKGFQSPYNGPIQTMRLNSSINEPPNPQLYLLPPGSICYSVPGSKDIIGKVC